MAAGGGDELLASWNDGPAVAAIRDFVARVTTDGSPEFLAPEERVAVFDNDGTLWCEKPMPIELVFILQRLAAMAERDPALRDRQPWKAAHDKDYGWLGGAITRHYHGDDRDVKVLMGGILQAFAGMSVDDYQAAAHAFLHTGRHPTLDRRFRDCGYRPMVDLLRYLEANGFTSFIASGGDRDFMRPVTDAIYAIPAERVIGSSNALEYQEDEHGGSVVYMAKPDVFDDGPVKPVRIWSRIGRRPVLAAGNSNGDIPMLSFAGGPSRPALRLLLLHDDPDREFDYTAGAERSLEQARAQGWTVVSIRNDWATVFSDVIGGDGGTPAPGASHPLQRLGADEIRLAKTLLAEHGLVGARTRFAYLGLEEPPKAEVLAFRAGEPVERRVRVILLDEATGDAADVVASLTRGAIDTHVALDTAHEGQPPIMLEDLMAVDEIVKGDSGWRAAIKRRGVTDLDLVRPCPLSAGSFGLPGEEGRRMLRVLSFVQHHEKDHPWAHPVDGLVAYVDLIERRVLHLIDSELLPIPEEEGNFDDPAAVGPARTSLRPIQITQPEGPSFTVDGDEVAWEGWRLRVGFDAREGLTLHQLSLWDRPVVYRASIAEMMVPYADPGPARFWQNYFDAGEYLLGQQVVSLMLGCDCLGEIRYLDAVLPTGDGEPREVPNAICMHEEDVGVAWKHNDLFTGSAETRRMRRLVISSFVAIGNYDYGFFWYLYLDGRIELEVKATGVVFTSSYVDGSRWATQVAPGLGAPYHQHLFSARLDMTVDGVDNAVDEVQLKRLPVGPDNPHGNAFTRKVTRLARESDGLRSADPSVARSWQVVNPASTNRLGQPVAYALDPQGAPLLAADTGAAITSRAAFATRHLWVTRYDPAQRYAAGDLPNQHPGGAGLPTYVAADRDIDGHDIVLWHTFGMTHFPRPEDWPVMPVATCGFTLRPVGFFDRNPVLDLPRSWTSSSRRWHP